MGGAKVPELSTCLQQCACKLQGQGERKIQLMEKCQEVLSLQFTLCFGQRRESCIMV